MKKTFLFIVVLLLSTAYTQDVQKPEPEKLNSIYVQNFIIIPILNYDRMIPLTEDAGIFLKAGILFMPVADISFYIKHGRHIFEAGGGIWDIQGAEYEGTVLNINYRYAGKKGLLIKAGFHYIPEEELFPILAVGYSF